MAGARDDDELEVLGRGGDPPVLAFTGLSFGKVGASCGEASHMCNLSLYIAYKRMCVPLP